MLSVDIKVHVCDGPILNILEITQFSQIDLFSLKPILSLKSTFKCRYEPLYIPHGLVDRNIGTIYDPFVLVIVIIFVDLRRLLVGGRSVQEA